MRRRWALCALGAACSLGLGGGVEARELPEFTSHRLRLSGLVTGVRMVDLDRDGRRDLVVVASRRVLVYRQRADGFPEWADAVRSLPRGAVLVDLWDPGAPAAPRLLILDRRGIRELVWTGKAFAKKAPRVLKLTTA